MKMIIYWDHVYSCVHNSFVIDYFPKQDIPMAKLNKTTLIIW